MASKKEKSFEENLEQLEEIIAQLEGGDLALEKAFDYYKEGMDLSLSCSDKLKKIEKKVLQIQKNQEGELVVSSYESEGDL